MRAAVVGLAPQKRPYGSSGGTRCHEKGGQGESGDEMEKTRKVEGMVRKNAEIEDTSKYVKDFTYRVC
jgi:hypothetical protein